MTHAEDGREIIPAGEQPPLGYRHLLPIVKLLIRRNHLPIDFRDRYGFMGNGGGFVCGLTHALTDEDWAAVNERFVVPDTIVFRFGIIADHANRADIQGVDEIIDVGDVTVPIAEWEAREDWSDLPADVASAAPAIAYRPVDREGHLQQPTDLGLLEDRPD